MAGTGEIPGAPPPFVSTGDPFLDWYHGIGAAPAPAVALPFEQPPPAQAAPVPAAPVPAVAPVVEPPQPGPPVVDGGEVDLRTPLTPEELAAGDALRNGGPPPPEPPLPGQLPAGAAPAPGGPPAPGQPAAAQAIPPDAGVAPDAISGGALPPKLSELPDITVSQETPLARALDKAGGNPLAIEDDDLRTQAVTELATRDPEGFLRLQESWNRKRTADTAAAAAAASEANLQAIKDNVAAREHADAITARKAAELEADANRIANTKIDPSGNLGTSQKIAGILGAIVGGLVQGRSGGRNAGLDAFEALIERNIAAQKADLQNQLQGVAGRKSALAAEYARHGDAFQAAETVRVATYQNAINQLQAAQQNFDPRSATALQIGKDIADLRQRQAAGANAYLQQQHKNAQDDWKIRIDAGRAAEAARHDQAMEAIDLFKAKPGGALGGAGGNTNPNYTVPTGIFDPFTEEPILGKRKLSDKGEKSEERTINAQIVTYKNVQDGWQRLAEIGRRIDYHKSLGESVWKKFASTDAAAYDAATSSLVVGITKELGDKLTQGQLDEQGHRIPRRTSWLESRDVGKMIADAQEESDQNFATAMNTVGINPRPIIAHARQMRAAAPQPESTTELDAAQRALADAQTPAQKKDAQAAIEAAKEHATQGNVAADEANQAIKEADTAAPGTKILDRAWMPPALRTEVQAHDVAVTTYNQDLEKYKKLATEKVPTSKLKGDSYRLAEDHAAQVSKAAVGLAKARKSIEDAKAGIVDSVADAIEKPGYGGVPAKLVQKLAGGSDTTPPAEDAPNSAIARRKFAAGLRNARKTPADLDAAIATIYDTHINEDGDDGQPPGPAPEDWTKLGAPAPRHTLNPADVDLRANERPIAPFLPPTGRPPNGSRWVGSKLIGPKGEVLRDVNKEPLSANPLLKQEPLSNWPDGRDLPPAWRTR